MLTASFFSPGLDWRDSRCVSIARSAPAGYRGARYPALAPSAELLRSYKAGDIDRERYELTYRGETLARLDPREVYRLLGKGAILLCWERATPGFFCHRRLVARWLECNLGIVVPEWRGTDG